MGSSGSDVHPFFSYSFFSLPFLALFSCEVCLCRHPYDGTRGRAVHEYKVDSGHNDVAEFDWHHHAQGTTPQDAIRVSHPTRVVPTLCEGQEDDVERQVHEDQVDVNVKVLKVALRVYVWMLVIHPSPHVKLK